MSHSHLDRSGASRSVPCPACNAQVSTSDRAGSRYLRCGSCGERFPRSKIPLQRRMEDPFIPHDLRWLIVIAVAIMVATVFGTTLLALLLAS